MTNWWSDRSESTDNNSEVYCSPRSYHDFDREAVVEEAQYYERHGWGYNNEDLQLATHEWLFEIFTFLEIFLVFVRIEFCTVPWDIGLSAFSIPLSPFWTIQSSL